jgi:NAD-dependent SIR2 family protein deacetylase
MPKTVFIVGAGFSAPAGIPGQGDLLKTALSYPDLPPDLSRHREDLLRFVERIYGLDPERAASLDLEDIYTPLHQAISRNEYLKTVAPADLREIENALNLLVSHVIDNGRRPDQFRYDYVDKFVAPLLHQKSESPTTDSFSIISLNWDILLDKRLYALMGDNGVLDYCCHYTGIDQENKMMPGLLARQAGKYAVKLLKIHGSLNWLNCPQCDRLFINKDEKIGILGFSGGTTCSFCEGVDLDAAILLPSFRKDLASFHFQHVWNQAAIELAEATKIVFIGYSFPLADFDFRSLITKHLTDAKVEVVLYSDTEGPNEAGRRFQRFFGEKIEDPIHYGGVEEYVDRHFPFPTP